MVDFVMNLTDKRLEIGFSGVSIYIYSLVLELLIKSLFVK